MVFYTACAKEKERVYFTFSDQGVAGSSGNPTLVISAPAHLDVSLVTPSETPAMERYKLQQCFTSIFGRYKQEVSMLLSVNSASHSVFSAKPLR